MKPKPLFSIVLLKFDPGTREAYHSHACVFLAKSLCERIKMSRNDFVEVTITLLSETGKAWFVDAGGDPAWVPKSQAEIEQDDNKKTWTLTCPEWLALEKGLI